MDGVILVTGVPGSGKTTVARLLTQRFPLAAHLEGDSIQSLIVSGGLHPDREPHDEAMRQLRLRTRNVSLLADSFAANGVEKTVFGIWAHLDAEFREALQGRGLWLDTSNLSADETVSRALERLNEAVIG